MGYALGNTKIFNIKYYFVAKLYVFTPKLLKTIIKFKQKDIKIYIFNIKFKVKSKFKEL